jgi:hypothetical protein
MTARKNEVMKPLHCAFNKISIFVTLRIVGMKNLPNLRPLHKNLLLNLVNKFIFRSLKGITFHLKGNKECFSHSHLYLISGVCVGKFN